MQSLEGQTSLPEVDYSGRGERLARVVADIIQGGQVVLTEAAWSHVQDQLPGQAQVRPAHHQIQEVLLKYNKAHAKLLQFHHMLFDQVVVLERSIICRESSLSTRLQF